VNVFAPALLIECAAEWLRRCGAGKVVNLCDISAERPWPGYSAYCASKAALVNLTRSVARKLAPEVQVNGVSPGIAEFPEDYSTQLRERLIAKVPLKRAGSPQDIAHAVRFLVEHGDYITGQIINVDGGRSIS
jgi:pteridine reductase